MIRRYISLVLVTLLVTAATAVAADSTTPAAAGTAATAASATSGDAAEAARLLALAREPKRPPMLTVLYGTYATLQVADIVSTRKAIDGGAREANPLMGSGQTARLIAMKAAGSAASIYLAEKIWKKNRVGAIVTMAAMNGLTAAVLAHNTHLHQ